MKRVFLVLGIAVFSSASAQNKNLVNSENYLQNILKEKQQLSKPFVFHSERETSFLFSPKLSHIAPNGDKVYVLSQDKMLCVIPEMSQFNMPNVSNPSDYFKSLPFNPTIPGTIPNVVRPYRLMLSK